MAWRGPFKPRVRGQPISAHSIPFIDRRSVLPEHMCTSEAERHEWRADVLGFIRDHIDASEMYQLGEADLAFGELLPEEPAADAAFSLTHPTRES